MIYCEKLAVFDLDGTLWKENSHIEILCKYYDTKFFKSFIFRLISHFKRKKMYRYICEKYEKIPKEYIDTFCLKFDNNMIDRMESLKKKFYKCIIVSNAPEEIVINAAKRLNLDYIRAPAGLKKEYLDKVYTYNNLYVCTDNIEDIDLIQTANEYFIVVNRNNKKYFTSKGFI